MTVQVADGLRYGFRLLGFALALVLVCGSVLAGGGALAWSGYDAADPANSQFPRVGAGALIALVGALSLLGGAAGLLYKFVADAVAAGLAAPGEPRTAATAAGDGEPETASDAGDERTGENRPRPAEPPAEGDGLRGEELDRVVSEATDPGGPVPADGRQGTGGDDLGGTEPTATGAGRPQSADQPDPLDDRGSGSDVDDGATAVDGESVGDSLEPEFEDIEDTTDDPGDWQPLDRDD